MKSERLVYRQHAAQPHALTCAVACIVALAFAAGTAHASTVAYWRHEEGTDGGLIPAGPNTVLDSSGNDHHMQTFDPAFTSATYTSNVSPVPLRSGQPNTLSLDFGPGGDDAGLNDDNFSDGKSINAQLFSALTAELAFSMDTIGGFQALFGKDGAPINSPVPPLKFLVRGDDFPNSIPNQLFIEWIDGDGDIHFLASGSTVTAGAWNHVAFVLTDTNAELYLAGEDGVYQLVDSKGGEDFAGLSGEVLFDSDANYSIGRGAFGGGVADWSDALIDEVRLSDMALRPSEFLFVPEPHALVLAMFACFGFTCRREPCRRQR